MAKAPRFGPLLLEMLKRSVAVISLAAMFSAHISLEMCCCMSPGVDAGSCVTALLLLLLQCVSNTEWPGSILALTLQWLPPGTLDILTAAAAASCPATIPHALAVL